MATHDLDLTAWLTDSHYTSITARTTHRSGRPHEDLLAALGQLADATLAQHHVAWLSPYRTRTTAVTGDQGVLMADTLTGRLTYWSHKRSGQPQNIHLPIRSSAERTTTRGNALPLDPLTSEHAAFRDLVLGGEQLPATVQDGLHAVLTAHAALRSSRTGTFNTVGMNFSRPSLGADPPYARGS